MGDLPLRGEATLDPEFARILARQVEDTEEMCFDLPPTSAALINGVPYATRETREVVGALVNRHDAYAFDPIGFVTGLPMR